MARGSRVMDMGSPRARDSAQPYIVFDRTTIERSGAANLEDFLRNRLPQNTVSAPTSQTGFQQGGLIGNGSQINLRALGANQTLILIDGHRTANVSGLADPQ